MLMLWMFLSIGLAEPVAAAPDDTARLLIYSEPPVRGDDRVATRIEELLREREPLLRRCRADHLDADPGRFIQFYIKWGLNGTAKRFRKLETTGNDAVDACVEQLVRDLRLEPPPQFSEVYELAITWQKTLPPNAGEADNQN
ncbi:MAG: hypothetical protein ACON5B_09220 [Myxococcota bacterium]